MLKYIEIEIDIWMDARTITYNRFYDVSIVLRRGHGLAISVSNVYQRILSSNPSSRRNFGTPEWQLDREFPRSSAAPRRS